MTDRKPWPPRDWPPKVGARLRRVGQIGKPELLGHVVGVVEPENDWPVAVIRFWSHRYRSWSYQTLEITAWHVGLWRKEQRR